MKKAVGSIIISILFFSCALTWIPTVYATNYDAKIQDANTRKKELESKKKKLKSEVKNLQKDKSDVMKYVEKLDKKVAESSKKVTELSSRIATLEAGLKEARKQVEVSKNLETVQYDAMKKRIKYMYENGEGQYLDILFGAKDVGELLNRAEYIEKISEYDSKMIQKLKETRAAISKKSEEITQKLEDVKDSREEAKANKDAMKELNDSKHAELSKYSSDIKSANSKAAKYQAEMAKQEALVEKLLQQKAAAIAAEEKKKEAEAAKKGKTVKDQYTGTTGFRWPLQVSGRISSTFGRRSAPTAGASTYHKGIDIAVSAGTPIVAIQSGKVVTATYSSSAGNYIMIYHGKGINSVYMHCSKLAVSNGTSVKKGQIIGYVGSTGISTGAHLHFGIMVNGSYTNPLSYVSA